MLLRCSGCSAVRPEELGCKCPLCLSEESIQVTSATLVAEVAYLPAESLSFLHQLLTSLEGEAHVWH
jgi:uncharacterized paraquat-inducible protein A